MRLTRRLVLLGLAIGALAGGGGGGAGLGPRNQGAVAQDARASAAGRFITLASTTSTEQSGLFEHLLPLFRQASGIELRVVAVGTGQALSLGARGDVDAVLVHDRAGEDRFVAEGHGIDRRDVMHNDLVIVGPAADPAMAKGQTVAEALARIARAKAPFASRGDDSGTHRSELWLWERANVDPRKAREGGVRPPWYRELGAGMGATLNTAAGLDAYALTDRATWAAFGNRQSLVILVEGDASLLNPYGSILVNPAKGPHIKAADARVWHEWLTAPAGQAAIRAYRINGETLFVPDAAPRS